MIMECLKAVLICLLLGTPWVKSQENQPPPLLPIPQLQPEALYQRSHQDVAPNPPNAIQEIDKNGDPIVGLGLGFPIARATAAGAQARAKAAVLHHMVGAQALALKAKADFHRHVLDTKIKQDLAAAKARAASHRLLFHPLAPRLGSTHQDGSAQELPDTNNHNVSKILHHLAAAKARDNHLNSQPLAPRLGSTHQDLPVHPGDGTAHPNPSLLENPLDRNQEGQLRKIRNIEDLNQGLQFASSSLEGHRIARNLAEDFSENNLNGIKKDQLSIPRYIENYIRRSNEEELFKDNKVPKEIVQDSTQRSTGSNKDGFGIITKNNQFKDGTIHNNSTGKNNHDINRFKRDIWKGQWRDTRKRKQRRNISKLTNESPLTTDRLARDANRQDRERFINQDTIKNTGRSNMKRDERLFVWSLNNMSPYKRSTPQQSSVNIHVLGNPFFWNNNEIIPFSINMEDITQQGNNLLPTYSDGNAQPNLTPIYNNPTSRSSDDQVTPQKTLDGFRSDAREAHFHHSIFHHHDHGFHKTGHFGGLHASSSSFAEAQPGFQNDHWGQSISNNAINNLLPNINPTQVTINNQQNTFSNAVPTSGSQTIQISQTNGQATSSQAQATRTPLQRSNVETVAAPYLIQVPYRRHVYKRSISSKNFNDILMDDNFLEEKHLRRGDLKHSNLQKRSLPLFKLMADPNAKLDMPKTLTNVGTIARNSFEDKRQPLYHVRNMVGSVKNAVLSTLKMAPQDLIIPSQYRIVDTNTDAVMKNEDVLQMRSAQITTETPPDPPIIPVTEKPLSFREKLLRFRQDLNPRFPKEFKPKVINEARLKEVAFKPKSDPILGQSAPTTQTHEDDPFNFLGTFQKVGTVLRDSVRSGQETIQHISDAAHSARKVLHTSRFAAPRMLLPYSRAAALKKDNKLDKFMFISPRFLDVGDGDSVTPVKDDKFVRMGEIMDAVGMSNPNEESVGLRKITIQKNNPLLQSRFGDEGDDRSKYLVIGEDIDEDFPVQFSETWKTLEGLKSAVGVNTVKDFLHGMKNDFNRVRMNMRFGGDGEDNLVGETVSEDDELSSFLKDLFTKSKDLEVVGEKLREHARGQSDERVGAGLNLPPNLLQPFMSQPSRSELNAFLKDNGDSIETAQDDTPNFLTRQSLVTSINPDMFQKLFNETLKINSSSIVQHPEKLFKGDGIVMMPNPDVDEDELRTSMKFHDKLLKPYMGKLKDNEEDYGQPYGDYGPFNNEGYYDEDDLYRSNN